MISRFLIYKKILNKTWLDTDITTFLKSSSVTNIRINHANEYLLEFFE